jgi:hypothetical protein
MPTRGLAELDDSGEKTAYSFESFATGFSQYQCLDNGLEAHLRVCKPTLGHDARVPRLRGVVAADSGRIAGTLLTYTDPRDESDGLLFEDRLLHTPIPL